MIIEIIAGEQREWCMLEFQGEIFADRVDEVLNDYELGECVVEGDRVHMEIGQHALEGKIVPLTEPFLVLKNSNGQFSTNGVVTRKFVFKTRPKPIVTRRASKGLLG